MNVPSLKSHPVVASVIVMLIFIGVFIGGMIGGWTLRAAMESRAELAVVLDDSEFMKMLELRAEQWGDEFLSEQERFYEQNPEIPDCLAKPMPDPYLDRDYGLRSTRQ